MTESVRIRCLKGRMNGPADPFFYQRNEWQIRQETERKVSLR